MKRQSLKLDEIDWQALTGIAADLRSEYRGEPSWRRLFDDIASGNLSVVNRPDKRVKAFQEKLRRPEQAQQLAKFKARIERDRLRQQRIRRAAGIPARSSLKPPEPPSENIR